jgi:tRNA pseudouridine13 synthase
MKIKVLPQDFVVEEICSIDLKNWGNFSIYKLEKENWDTFDLLDYLRRKYKLKNISRAGIKDRYSHSIQYISIEYGRPADITEKNFKLTYLGKTEEPITLDSQQGNLFKIVIRDLNHKETEYILSNLAVVHKFGLINYYDEQRMGSARAGQGFIAEKLVREHYNGALKLYLASPSKFDDGKTRKLKKYLFENWGDWQKCISAPFALGAFQHPLNYLAQYPKDFKGAVKTIRKDLLEMFINAYQAYVWNESIKELLNKKKIKYLKCRYGFGDLYFYQELSNNDYIYLKDLSISVPSYKAKFIEEQIKELMEQVLAKDNLRLKDLKIYLKIKGLFFKPYQRKVLMLPQNLKVNEVGLDEVYPNKHKIELSFNLPKGSYATILIKRITSLQV